MARKFYITDKEGFRVKNKEYSSYAQAIKAAIKESRKDNAKYVVSSKVAWKKIRTGFSGSYSLFKKRIEFVFWKIVFCRDYFLGFRW